VFFQLPDIISLHIVGSDRLLSLFAEVTYSFLTTSLFIDANYTLCGVLILEPLCDVGCVRSVVFV